MTTSAQSDDGRVTLIGMAEQLALVGSGGSIAPTRETRFLERFRAAYDYLAATVYSTPGSGRRGGAPELPGWGD